MSLGYSFWVRVPVASSSNSVNFHTSPTSPLPHTSLHLYLYPAQPPGSPVPLPLMRPNPRWGFPPLTPNRLLHPPHNCSLQQFISRLFPDHSFQSHSPLSPYIPYGRISPLYSVLKAHTQLEVSTCRLCLVPHRSKNEFGKGLEDHLPNYHRPHPGILSKATMRHTISAQCVTQWGEELVIQSARSAMTPLNPSYADPKQTNQLFSSIPTKLYHNLLYHIILYVMIMFYMHSIELLE